MIVEPDLEVPHPRFRERFFVLGPLAEIAPDLVDPVTGLGVGSCCGGSSGTRAGELDRTMNDEL